MTKLTVGNTTAKNIEVDETAGVVGTSADIIIADETETTEETTATETTTDAEAIEPVEAETEAETEAIETEAETEADTLTYHVGNSDYSSHAIQPWQIWAEYDLNPWDADLIKRILRKKKAVGKNMKESRIEDYEKMIHCCKHRISQLKTN